MAVHLVYGIEIAKICQKQLFDVLEVSSSIARNMVSPLQVRRVG